MLDGMTSFLFGFGEAFAPGPAQLIYQGAGGSYKQTYLAVVLVRCLRFAGLLRSTSDIRKACDHALDLSLPKHVASLIRNTFMSERLPLPSVLSRFRVVMDCGFMLWMRNHNRRLQERHLLEGGPRPARCLLSDSSPQGLENWQITESYTVLDCVRAASFVDGLASMASGIATKVDNGEALDDEVTDKHGELTYKLLEAMEHHILPPTGLGFRKVCAHIERDRPLHAQRVVEHGGLVGRMHTRLAFACGCRNSSGVDVFVGVGSASKTRQARILALTNALRCDLIDRVAMATQQ